MSAYVTRADIRALLRVARLLVKKRPGQAASEARVVVRAIERRGRLARIASRVERVRVGRALLKEPEGT